MPEKELDGSDGEKVMVAQDAYQELLGGFYEEYKDIMAPEQYLTAKDDRDYFLVLIQLAYYDQEFEKVDKQRGQLIPYMNWKLFTQIIGGHYGREITRQIQSGHKGNRG